MSEQVSIVQQLSERCRKEHVELLSGLANKTAWNKEADLGYGNQVVSVAHDDRTVLELVQNARDAIVEGENEGESRVSVIVGPESLIVANTGSPFRLNQEDVFDAVTSLGRSAKAQDRGSVGEKGVGLKSILQTSEQFRIHSEADGHRLSTHFSRARAGRMLLATYKDLLAESTFTEQLENDHNDDLAQACREFSPEFDTYPTYVDPDQMCAQLLAELEEQEPPGPESILSDLPRLSLFRYPFPISVPEAGSPVYSTLVGTADTVDSSTTNFGSGLRSWIEEGTTSFTTVLELDYVDDEWRSLLDRIEDVLSETDAEALSTFRDNRSSATTDRDQFTTQRQEELWQECVDISPETLILLGEIDQLDLVRVGRDEEETLRLDDYRKIRIESEGQTPLSNAPEVSRRSVTYEKTESWTGDDVVETRVFRQYAQTYTDLRATDEEEDTKDDLHLLVENPKPNTEWRPRPKPLFLYYPIEDVETPFPFAIHAPFRVDFDRQSLADDDQNRRILAKLPALIRKAAIDLASNESTDAGPPTSFAKWMPWLTTPVTSPDAEATITDHFRAIFDRLRDAPIVPTDTGEPLAPRETLVDPQRLLAFEALRERTANPPLPRADVVGTGIVWRDAVTGGPGEFDDWVGNIGLTAILDRTADSENGRGSIDLLCDLWQAADLETNDRAVRMDHPRYAEQYFGAILGILRSASADDELDLDDGTDAKDAARTLGNNRVPLLPAEAHQEGADADRPTVTHLVRAQFRDRTTDGSRASRSDRIVFRRAASSDDADRSSIGNLPTPPDELPVFVIPFRTSWSAALAGYNRDWGTRSLDSPTAFYRRIAAEAGGFSGEPRADTAVLEYLVDLYDTVTQRQVAESLRPKPHHHHQFEAVENTLEGAEIDDAPTDYDDFLEQRYTQRVRLPVTAGGREGDSTMQPAETLTFGAGWAAEFADAADVLEADDSDTYQFDGDDSGEETRAEAFRRWSAAIEFAAEARGDDSHEVAPPDDECWNDVFGEIDSDDTLDRVRRLDTLIHFGVQVGPRIQWQWALPKHAHRNPTAMPPSLAEELSCGNLPDDGSFSPPADLLTHYRDVVWCSDNDPAFSASHSDKCEEKWVQPDIDEWVGRYNDVLIPTWWFFPDFPDLESDRGRSHRNAALLIWPELDDALVETAWLCNSQHQFYSHRDTIPSLGIVQLARQELWPAETPSEDGSDERIDIREGELFRAQRLLLTETETSRGAARYLPRVDVDALKQSLDEKTGDFESVRVDLTSALRSLGITRIDDLTPPMAADRLEWFVSEFTETDTLGNKRAIPTEISWSARSMSVPVNGLMRQLVSDEALSRRFEEQEPKRQWIRRDLHNLGTFVPITEGESSKALHIGAQSPPGNEPDADVFTEPLSKFARARLVNDGQSFVERPAEPVEVAYVLGDDDGVEPFGIRRNNDPPEPLAVQEPATELRDEQLEKLRSHLKSRHDFFLAAYLENTPGRDLEAVHKKLRDVFENPIGVVNRGGKDGRRNSAEWAVSEGMAAPRIALFSDSLDQSMNTGNDESMDIPAYLAADGLVQVIEQYDLKDTFEAILLKDPPALKNEYRNTLPTVRSEITELRARRLEQAHEALQSLCTVITEGATLASPDEFDVDPRGTLETIQEAAMSIGSDDAESAAKTTLEAPSTDNPLLDSWITELIDGCGLSPENAGICLRTAATEDHEYRLQGAIHLDRDDVLDVESLANAGGRWRALDRWPDRAGYRRLEAYVEEAARIQRFFEYLTEYEDEGEEGIHRAARRSTSVSQFPGPLTTGGEFVPTPRALATDLRDRRLAEYVDMEREPPAIDALSDAFRSWVSDEREDLQNSDVVYRDPEIDELLDRLVDAAGRLGTNAGDVNDPLETYLSQSGSSSPSTGPTRSDRTRDWIADSDDSLRDISQKFAETSPSSTTKGGSPDISESSGGGYDHVNAQIDSRGREGELICLERAWNRFADSPSPVRSRILRTVQEWRGYETWRLDSITDVVASASDQVLQNVADCEELIDILSGETVDRNRTERAAFHAVFDTSAERGPGFDLIDPFAGMPEDQSLSEWSPHWMQRVEAKAVASNKLRNGRIKLTGNELRMALRDGPNGARQYLVRLVGYPTDWRDEEFDSGDVQLFDIDDVVDFANLDPDAAAILEKLRGGSFYITFSLSE
jgi:hypothetical protein